MLQRNAPPVLLAETLPSRWADFVRNAPVKDLGWGTRAAPQQAQPFAAPPGGQPRASFRSGSANALYFGSVPGGQLDPDAQPPQPPPPPQL